jgi:peptide/nickel transport system permease protein
MGRYLVRRLLQAIPVFVAITLLSFILINSVPGGPTARLELDQDIRPEDVERIKINMGLDQPVWKRYLIWLGILPNSKGKHTGLLQGDLGISYINQTPVAESILERLPNTLLLTGVSLVLSLLLAIPLGVISAVRQHSWMDNVATVMSTAGVSIPSFWFGLMAILLFSVELRWLPSGGMYTLGKDRSIVDLLKHLIMPGLILSLLNIAGWNRYVRGSMLEVIGQDYVRTARAKGLREQVVIIRHALRNALIPVATLIGLSIPGLVSGAIITETVFGWPGMGRLAYHAAQKRDYSVSMGVLVISAVMVILGNLLADVAYTYLDPRIRLE